MRILTKTRTLIVFDLEMDNCDGMTVADLKLKLQNFPDIQILADEQCLRYDGKFLNDTMLLNDILGVEKKREIFYLTNLRCSKNIEPNDDEENVGAVGGQTIMEINGNSMPTKLSTMKLTDEIDKCSILTESDFKNLTNIPELNLSTDDNEQHHNDGNGNDDDNNVDCGDENAATVDVFDEDMELPPDLQQYYTRNINVDKNLVNKLCAMGYEENDVNNALQASFNDPERAVEYLIDGLPTNSIFLNSTTQTNIDNIDISRTPPPSYAGSICSDYSMASMPQQSPIPTPHTTVDVVANTTTNLFSCKYHKENNESEAFKNAKNENNNNNNNNKNNTNTSSESEHQGYDANDEADATNFQLGKRKRKMSCKYKKRRIEVWAAKATLATTTAARNQQTHTQNIQQQQQQKEDTEADADDEKNQIEIDKKAEKELIEQMNFTTISDVAIAVMESLPVPVTIPITVPMPMDTTEITTADANKTEDANTAGGDHNKKTNSKV